MVKKVKKIKKIKFFPIFLFIVIGVFLYFLISYALQFKMQNIYIHGTKYLNDEYILEQAKIEDYPSFISTFSWNIEKGLKSSPYIKNATVKKGFLGVVDLYIEESDVLFYREYDKKYILDTFEEVDSLIYNKTVTTLINYIPDTVYPSFQDKFSNLDEQVIDKISQVKYDPSEYDDSRFLFYMVDGNYVYITVTKLDSINYYNEIYPTLNDKKGILYLDSGNHFQEF